MKNNIIQMKNVEPAQNRDITLNAETPLDGIISHKGGTPPGTNYMLVGAPGTGKSTIGLDYLARLESQGKKVLYVNAEMNTHDMAEYCERYPEFREVPILFLTGSIEGLNELKELLTCTLQDGYDLVLIDSWAEVIESIKIGSGCGFGAAEKWLMQLLMSNNEGENDRQVSTSFFIIQQMTKAGDFAGSNRMKHITTGMLHLNFEEGENSDCRYMELSKNRRGKVNQRLYYQFDDNGRHWFDGARHESEQQHKVHIESEQNIRQEENTVFEEWLKTAEFEAQEASISHDVHAPF